MIKIMGAWKGEPAYVLGGGPSLKGFDFRKLEGKHSIGVGLALRDYIGFEWFLFYHHETIDILKNELSIYQGTIFAQYWQEKRLASRENVVYFKNVKNADEPTENIEDGLYNGFLCGIAATHLAILSGADPIYLLGMDCGGGTRGDTHYRKDYEEPFAYKESPAKYRSGASHFDKFAPWGDRIVNLSPNSAITTFKKSGWKEHFMSRKTNNMIVFWENTSPRNAHLGQDGETDDMFAKYEESFAKTNVKGNVIDFGCGGGLLGLYLTRKHSPKKYIAYDIAERSLAIAKKNVPEGEFNIINTNTFNFAAKKPDIIISLACMIHFPNKVYLDNFLAACNISGAGKLILEIRDTGRGTIFQKDAYAFPLKTKRTCLTCETSAGYVASKLTGYELMDKTDPAKAPTNCQVLWFKKKRAAK
jgi:hypothetical protein